MSIFKKRNEKLGDSEVLYKAGHDWIVFNLEYKRKRKPKRNRKAGVDQNDR